MVQNSAQSRGFSSRSAAPRRFTRLLISFPAFPVTTSTGMCLVLVDSFNFLSTSIPDPPGVTE